jgi:hypothetical protein
VNAKDSMSEFDELNDLFSILSIVVLYKRVESVKCEFCSAMLRLPTVSVEGRLKVMQCLIVECGESMNMLNVDVMQGNCQAIP